MVLDISVIRRVAAAAAAATVAREKRAKLSIDVDKIWIALRFKRFSRLLA